MLGQIFAGILDYIPPWAAVMEVSHALESAADDVRCKTTRSTRRPSKQDAASMSLRTACLQVHAINGTINSASSRSTIGLEPQRTLRHRPISVR